MRSKYTRAGLLCLMIAAMSMITASAAMAVKISPVNNTIQLKATNMKLHWVGGESVEPTTCELWQTSGKINSSGTLPVGLEVPIFGKGAGECTINLGPLGTYKGRVIEAEAEQLEASSKTSASIGHGSFVIQLETKKAEEKGECQLEVGRAPYKGVWANGTSKEKKVVTPSTLTISEPETAIGSTACYLWGKVAGPATLSAKFNVTDTTESNSLVVLE